MNQQQWAQLVLVTAGLPDNATNEDNIMRWMVAEEPSSNWYHNNNPLNINAAGTGSDRFASLNDSATRTAAYLAMPNYVGIRAALQSSADPNAFSAAVVASPWAASHYGGNPLHIAQIPVPTLKDAGTGALSGAPAQSGPTSGASPALPAGISIGGVSIVSGAQELAIKGWFLMIAGTGVAVVGLAVVLASLGLDSKVVRTVAGASPVGRVTRRARSAAPAASEPPESLPAPPAPAQAFRAGYDLGGRDENARREGQAQNARNRRQSGPSVPGARRSTTEQRRASRGRVERARAGMTAEQRRQADTF